MPTHCTRSHPRQQSRGLALRLARAALALLALLASGCAAGRDVALAPFWTDISLAGGGTEIEALAGAIRVRKAKPEGPTREWAVRPFVNERIEENEDRTLRFLVPLGSRKIRKFDYVWQLLFVARYRSTIDETGHREWSLLTIPLNYWAEDKTDRIARVIFPLGGMIEGFLTFDRAEFLMFPFFLRTVREGQVSTSFLWPIFNYTYGPFGRSWRVWPLFGVSRQRGRYDRGFFLWPFFTWGTNFLSSTEPERRFMLWPLYGRTQRGSYVAHTTLWPFFGYSHNPENGMWALDAPWPLVRFLRPGRDNPDGPRRSRIWPLWSHYRGDGMDSNWVAWPIVHWRTEVDPLGEKRTFLLMPLWQHWTRDFADGTGSSWTKLWPLFQDYQKGEEGRFAFPALNPFFRTPEIDFQYAWIYELFTREVDGPNSSLRTWGNIYRREADATEVRSYLSFLWSRRAYRDAGERCVERSLFFGLLRWRTHPERGGSGIELMAPAFPGPGWPKERLRDERP